MQETVRSEAEKFAGKYNRAPGLAVILVGDNPASKVYVQAKTKNAALCKIRTFDAKLPADTSQSQLHATIDKFNADPAVDGILLQLPLPKGLDEFAAISRIAPAKDVDGLHPETQGLLMRGGEGLIPCTPAGVIRLIEEARAQLKLSPDLSGLRAAVLGRSLLVGKPVSLLLLARNCTVTMCHSRTVNLPEICRQAEIIVAAIGQPQFLTAESVKPGAIVIDVGINRTDSGTLVGDVHYEEVLKLAGAITPVPGGVGPMTIAMLLANTVRAAEKVQ